MSVMRFLSWGGLGLLAIVLAVGCGPTGGGEVPKLKDSNAPTLKVAPGKGPAPAPQ